MKKLEIDGSTLLHYAYGLVMVFDQCETTLQARWTQQHQDQGFARRERSVLFSTLRQEGRARINAFEGLPSNLSQGDRIISVPLKSLSGKLNIQGLEEWPIERSIRVSPGINTVTLSQRIDEATNELVLDFFINMFPSDSSQILKADISLKVPPILLETADSV